MEINFQERMAYGSQKQQVECWLQGTVGEWEDVSQRLQMFGCKMNKFLRSHAQHSHYN